MGAHRYFLFPFKCSTRYLTSECSKQVRYKVEHEKRNSISTSNHVFYFYQYNYKHTKHFLKISEDCSKIGLLLGVEDTVDIKQQGRKEKKNKEHYMNNRFVRWCSIAMFPVSSTPRSQTLSEGQTYRYISVNFRIFSSDNERFPGNI